MINAAIYGIGRWGQTLLRATQGSDKIRISVGVDPELEALRGLADETGIALTDDYDAVLADPAIDAVVLAVPPFVRATLIEKATRAGKHVYAEKPIALKSSEARAAAAACREASVLLAVGFNRRFLPAVADMVKLVGEGLIGDILHVETQFSGPTALRTSGDIWRGTREANPAGGMVARGIHALDLMIWLCGRVGSVYALSDRRVVDIDIDDTTSMLFRFAGGATGYLATIMATGDYWRTHVFGTKGWIELHGTNELILSDLDRVTDRRTYEPFDTERAELEAFADAVAGNGPFLVAPEDAVHGIEVLEAIVASAEAGSPKTIGGVQP